MALTLAAASIAHARATAPQLALLDELAAMPNITLDELRARHLIERVRDHGSVWSLVSIDVPHPPEMHALRQYTAENGGSALVLGYLPELAEVPGIDAIYFDERGRPVRNISIKSFTNLRTQNVRAGSFERRIKDAAAGLPRIYDEPRVRAFLYNRNLTDRRIEGMVRLLGISEASPRPASILIDASILRDAGAVVRFRQEDGQQRAFLHATSPAGASGDRRLLNGFFDSLTGKHRPLKEVSILLAWGSISFDGQSVTSHAPTRAGGPWILRTANLAPLSATRASALDPSPTDAEAVDENEDAAPPAEASARFCPVFGG